MALSTLTLSPERSSAGALRDWLRTVLADDGVPQGAAEQIVLAAEEALNSAILHAEQPDGEITITLSSVDSDVYLTVSDGAVDLDAERMQNGQSDAEDTAHLGLLLVRGLMDGVTQQSSAEGTIIRLVKHLRGSAGGS
jgi:anti-sigma regulatory factor (Ser/Thr protein kinase)